MSPTQTLPSPLDHQHRGQPPSPNYAHASYPGGDMYGQQPGGQPGYAGAPPGPPYYATGHDSGAAAAQQQGMPPQHAGWAQPGVQQGNHYGRR